MVKFLFLRLLLNSVIEGKILMSNRVSVQALLQESVLLLPLFDDFV